VLEFGAARFPAGADDALGREAVVGPQAVVVEGAGGQAAEFGAAQDHFFAGAVVERGRRSALGTREAVVLSVGLVLGIADVFDLAGRRGAFGVAFGEDRGGGLGHVPAPGRAEFEGGAGFEGSFFPDAPTRGAVGVGGDEAAVVNRFGFERFHCRRRFV
jgi:hypothetical protein